jgi:hypothetical protein
VLFDAMKSIAFMRMAFLACPEEKDLLVRGNFKKKKAPEYQVLF